MGDLICDNHMVTWFVIHMITIGILYVILYIEQVTSIIGDYVDMKNPTNILMVAFSTYTLARFGLASAYFAKCHHDKKMH